MYYITYTKWENNTMPTISVYVTNDTFAKILHNPSKIVQKALQEYFKSKEWESSK